MTKKVVLIGWHPDVVNYDKWPGLTPDKLRNGLNSEREKLNGLGFEATIALIRDGESGLEEVEKALDETAYDIVMIGAGVRKDDDHFLTFEKLVNVIHEHAPQARIAFNTNPSDTAEAMQRWA